MAAAARAEGINLHVVSAMRTWSHQRRIWNGKWNSARFMGFTGAARAAEILRYSSMPGSSRHHWGTDVDLNALENEYFESGAGAAVYAWLLENAYTYGFVQVYGDMRNGRTGYQEEKWHWSYWPLAEDFLSCYLELCPEEAFAGFEGASYSDSLCIIDRYVQGIDGPQ
jgi:LAS superfamily LD-carboxypeptidase LdcB